MRPMTFEDEKSLITSPQGQDPINIILTRCCTNINVGELLPMDKLYLIMKLREISYGDDYHTMLICPHCKHENPTVVKLSKLNVNPVPDDFTDPVDVLLPSLGKEAKVRLPRLVDEKFMKTTEESLANIWRFVVELDGHRDKQIISSVLKKLPIKDMRVILKAMKADYGVDTKVKFDCAGCGVQSVVELPIDSNFFDVN
tara:strand:- start:782 stop:1378 length:597 start_codon:yes stop_codon:yes gene_type:complete